MTSPADDSARRRSALRLGYNTNGLAHHRWDEAIALIAETGYRSVALTIDHHCLRPGSREQRTDLARLAALLERSQLGCVIETGARFLLNPRRKHDPTLVSPTAEGRRVRQRFLQYCVDVAAALDADAVSFWSGAVADACPRETAWARLVDGCRELCDYAAGRQVRLAFEPEPGMLAERCDDFRRLRDKLRAPHFGLTLDVGHVHCLQDGRIADRIREFADVLWNVHIEDMRVGVHEHLRFGTGTIDFPPVIAALAESGYAGGVHVELSRDSHQAPLVLAESYAFLARLLRSQGASA